MDDYIKEGYIPLSANVEIYYREYGSGEPLILLHGNGQNLHFLKKQVNFFKDKYKVITLDSRGHGKSSLGNESLSIDLLAEDLKDILCALSLDKVSILGFSDGGNVAMAFASLYPEKINKLILVSVNLNPNGIKVPFLIFMQLWHVFCHLFRKIPWFNRQTQRLSLITEGPYISTKGLNQITAPTLVLVGQRDLIHMTHIKHICKNLPQGRLEIIKKTGHFFLARKAEVVNPLMENFLKQ